MAGYTPLRGWLSPCVGGYTPLSGWLYPLTWVVIPPTFTLDADFHGDHESGLRCGCSQPTFPSIRHVQAIAHGCACSHCKMGLKMEVPGCYIFLFWHRIMYFNGLLAHRHIRCVLRDLERHASSPKTKSIFSPQL